MTYNHGQEKTNTLYAVHLLSSSVTLNSGDTIPYSISTGTSGHGITVSNGVITLSKGDWLISFTVESDASASYSADIYVNGSINNTFSQISNVNSTGVSNLESTAIPVLSDGTTTIEIRVDFTNVSTIDFSSNSDCMIYGFKI